MEPDPTQDSELAQRAEMDALTAIYGDQFAFTENPPSRFSGTLTVELDKHTTDQALASTGLSHLPPITIAFRLPTGYPFDAPPTTHITCTWMDEETLAHVRTALAQRAQIDKGMSLLDAYATTIKYDLPADQLHARVTAILSSRKSQLAQSLAAHDAARAAAAFAAQSHYCGICMDVHVGSACTRLACGHVHCTKCLSAYFAMLIRDRSLHLLKCPHHACRAHNTQLDPHDVIPLLAPDDAALYSRLVERRLVEVDGQRAWCPRAACERSVARTPNDALCVCECGFAFCALCDRAWHGANHCRVDNRAAVVAQYKAAVDSRDSAAIGRLAARYGERTLERMLRDHEDDVRSAETIRESTQMCPTCSVTIEKMYGCNHMVCAKCGTHFCYLCGAYVDKGDPFEHFNSRGSGCHMRLFEGVEAQGPADDDRELDEANLMIRLALDEG